MCEKYGVSILAYSPLQQGLLSGRFLTVDDVPMGRRRGKLFSPER
jgi:aryl-alcohol dehydrogenase-like predicted oxidoreductase